MREFVQKSLVEDLLDFSEVNIFDFNFKYFLQPHRLNDCLIGLTNKVFNGAGYTAPDVWKPDVWKPNVWKPNVWKIEAELGKLRLLTLLVARSFCQLGWPCCQSFRSQQSDLPPQVEQPSFTLSPWRSRIL